jgi:hypothetical protein
MPGSRKPQRLLGLVRGKIQAPVEGTHHYWHFLEASPGEQQSGDSGSGRGCEFSLQLSKLCLYLLQEAFLLGSYGRIDLACVASAND